MTIAQHEWLEQVGSLLRVIMETQRATYEPQAARMGMDLATFAAFAVLQYLVDHHGEEVEVVAEGRN